MYLYFSPYAFCSAMWYATRVSEPGSAIAPPLLPQSGWPLNGPRGDPFRWLLTAPSGEHNFYFFGPFPLRPGPFISRKRSPSAGCGQAKGCGLPGGGTGSPCGGGPLPSRSNTSRAWPSFRWAVGPAQWRGWRGPPTPHCPRRTLPCPGRVKRRPGQASF